jgi:hypothetical protein
MSSCVRISAATPFAATAKHAAVNNAAQAIVFV